MPILRKIYSILIDMVETLVIAGAIFVVIYAFLFRPFQVNGQSMYPNYDNGEYILTNLISLRLKTIDRGDVVVFESPANKEKDFIKRVIGIPGDEVMIKAGFVFVNEVKLDESRYLTSGVSSDSREWGYVTKDKIIGKSFLVYWPLTKFRLVQHADYNLINR